jgi:hypothetical protein
MLHTSLFVFIKSLVFSFEMKQWIALSLLLLFLTPFSTAQTKNVAVHFYYGSRPKLKYLGKEEHRFGGIHGGHVSIQTGDTIFSFLFSPPVHVIAHRRNQKGIWLMQRTNQWVDDTVNNKYTSFIVPLTNEQYVKLKTIQAGYSAKAPYDYAFIGMRCAAGTYDVFSQLGFFKHRSRFGMVSHVFYPKILRKKFFKLAEKNHWTIVKHEGNPRRRYERR